MSFTVKEIVEEFESESFYGWLRTDEKTNIPVVEDKTTVHLDGHFNKRQLQMLIQLIEDSQKCPVQQNL